MTAPRTHTNDPALIRRLLLTPATWAVVGLSSHTERTAYGVSGWLKNRLGHRIIPVHPRADEVFGEQGFTTLAEIPDGVHIEVVDCFVNSSRVGAIVDDAIDNAERLGISAVWLQLGVIDEDAAQRAKEAGLDVVMDTCPKIEYPRL
ncbi:CoA-binding protein [Hoyosella rhizosphaerae]|nr:CoA-binding protein [Hoyosella rhizosphaerae]MBN4927544.1 CoA-binding protein [Hoyosella rhizosphaerae]